MSARPAPWHPQSRCPFLWLQLLFWVACRSAVGKRAGDPVIVVRVGWMIGCSSLYAPVYMWYIARALHAVC